MSGRACSTGEREGWGLCRDPSAGHGGLAWDTRVWEDSLRVRRFQLRGMPEESVVMDTREGPAGFPGVSGGITVSLRVPSHLVTHLPLCSLPRGFRPF